MPKDIKRRPPQIRECPECNHDAMEFMTGYDDLIGSNYAIWYCWLCEHVEQPDGTEDWDMPGEDENQDYDDQPD